MSGRRVGGRVTAAAALLVAAGCHAAPTPRAEPVPDLPVPKELTKASHPIYVIESPDVLALTVTRVTPLPPYRLQPLDALYLNSPNALKGAPIQGVYLINPDGTINLGPVYGGTVRVADLTAVEAEAAVTAFARRAVKDVLVTVSLAHLREAEQLAGRHPVQSDGTIGLGTYGSVYVAGLTLQQARAAVERHLSRFLHNPEVGLDLAASRSKWFYVIADSAAGGEQVVRLPATGNETVLDALAQVGGLTAVSSKNVWIARPAPAGVDDQILPIDWKGITRRGNTATNYQVLPGDRIFIQAVPEPSADRRLHHFLPAFR